MNRRCMEIGDKVLKSASYSPNHTATVQWNDGTSNEVVNADKITCAGCEEAMYTREVEYLRYSGLCSPCFGKREYDVPGILRLFDRSYRFRRPVEQTRDLLRGWGTRPLGADVLGNNFGIEDVVLHRGNPDIKNEGVVSALFEYSLDRWHTLGYGLFLARTTFGRKSLQVPTTELEALTCKNIHYNTQKFEDTKMLQNTPCAFDPSQNKTLRPIFEHPIARAIWMEYRLNHLLCDSDLERLNTTSLEIAQILDGQQVARERMHLWFKKRFEGKMEHPMSHELVAYLVPYLMKEKEATYVVKPQERVVA